MPRPALPNHVLALLVLVLGAVSVDLLMPTPRRCAVQPDAWLSGAAADDDKTRSSSFTATCVNSLALADGRFREP